MSSKITSITLVQDKLLEKDVFPQKNGDRFHTTFATNVIQSILEKEDKCILTLLKDTTYSLSIKLKVNSNTVNSFKDFFGNNIYIFDKNKDCFTLIDEYDNFKVSHILIIGTVDKSNEDVSFEFGNITKKFLIIDDNVDVNTSKYTDVTVEEYLNLYYIEHFSLNIIEFYELYNKYIKNTEGVGQGEGGQRGQGGEEGQGGVEGGVGQGGGGGTEMTGKKKTVKKIKKTKNKVA